MVLKLGQPTVATAERAGLVFVVRLSDHTFRAGASVPVDLMTRNTSHGVIYVMRGDVAIQDEQGNRLPGGGADDSRHPPIIDKLAPGAEAKWGQQVRMPSPEEAVHHSYSLLAGVDFNPEDVGLTALWLTLFAGPIPLRLTPE